MVILGCVSNTHYSNLHPWDKMKKGFSQTHGHKKDANKSTKKLAENFLPAWLFLQKQFENWFLPTTLLKNDALSLVTRWSTGGRPCLISHPLLQLTIPKLFGCRENAEKISEKIKLQRTSDFFSTSLGTCWLNIVPLPSERWYKNH